MRKRAKLSLILLALALMGGLVTVTFSWFLSVADTPAFSTRSAVVDWRPDGGWTQSTILSYGNLTGGASTDSTGIVHILPSDSLLPTQTVKDGVRTVETAIARLPQVGETQGTIIRKETRFLEGDVTLSQTFREIKDPIAITDGWSPAAPSQTPDPRDYIIVTTSVTSSTTTPGAESDPYLNIVTTVVTTTTTYTPKSAEGTTYIYTVITSSPVTYERPTYAGGTQAQFEAAPLTGRLTSVETIQFTSDEVTRSRLVIHQYDTGLDDSSVDSEGRKPALPLSVGNRSTTETQLRVSLHALLTTESGAVTPLEQQWFGNTCYLGLTTGDQFIDLFMLTPVVGTEYQWLKATQDLPTARAVWNLSQAGSPIIPPAPFELEQETDADGNPVVDEVGDPVMVETDRIIEQFYPLFSAFTVAGTPHPGSPVSQVDFENKFNDLYCISSPTITVTLTYSARQSDYMTWSDFNTLTTTLALTE